MCVVTACSTDPFESVVVRLRAQSAGHILVPSASFYVAFGVTRDYIALSAFSFP